MGFALSLSGVLSDYRRYGVVARPGALPAASHLAGLANGINIVFVSCAGFILLLTPTGRLPSPRWRWWARVAAAAAVVFVTASVVDSLPFYPEYPQIGNPLGVQALAEPPLDVLIPVAGVVVLVALVVAAGSLVGRFRRARGVERQQLRWLAWGATLAATAPCSRRRSVPVWCRCWWPPGRRSCATGCTTSTALSAATLAVAAVFQPARRRIQQAVDRRFNRRRHDAAQLIEQFGARLRDQVDLDTLTRDLLAVVDQTMQPTQASRWLRHRARPPVTV